MAVALAHTDVWTERRRRVAELRSRQGFARQLLDFYGALLAVQERVFVEAVTAAPPPRAVVAYVAELVVPSIVDVSVGAGPDRLRAEVLQWLDRGEVHEILPGWMRGEAQPAVERYLARASLGPVLEALGQLKRSGRFVLKVGSRHRRCLAKRDASRSGLANQQYGIQTLPVDFAGTVRRRIDISPVHPVLNLALRDSGERGRLAHGERKLFPHPPPVGSAEAKLRS